MEGGRGRYCYRRSFRQGKGDLRSTITNSYIIVYVPRRNCNPNNLNKNTIRI